MSKVLKEVKKRLSRRFLGRSGIHALGINRAAGSVRVYVDIEKHPLPDEVMSELRECADPHPIEVIPEARASFH